MLSVLKEKYYQKRILGYCYQVSESHSGWNFQTFLIVSKKEKLINIPYTNFTVDTYYEKEMEIEELNNHGYQLIKKKNPNT